jgi:hypothetical protein
LVLVFIVDRAEHAEAGVPAAGVMVVGIDAGAFNSWLGDVGKPKGIKAKTPISKCEPSLFIIKTG